MGFVAMLLLICAMCWDCWRFCQLGSNWLASFTFTLQKKASMHCSHFLFNILNSTSIYIILCVGVGLIWFLIIPINKLTNYDIYTITHLTLCIYVSFINLISQQLKLIICLNPFQCIGQGLQYEVLSFFIRWEKWKYL